MTYAYSVPEKGGSLTRPLKPLVQKVVKDLERMIIRVGSDLSGFLRGTEDREVTDIHQPSRLCCGFAGR